MRRDDAMNQKDYEEIKKRNKDKLNRLNAPRPSKAKVFILDKYTPYTLDILPDMTILPLKDKYDMHGTMAGQVVSLILGNNVELHGSGYQSDITPIIDHCIQHDIRVINASIDFVYSKAKEAQLKRYADWGGVFVTSAGNTTGEVTYPGKSEYTIAVGSPNYATGGGEMLDCDAETDWWVRNKKQGQYIPFTHSSGSCPVVAAAVAILLDLYPHWQLEDVRKFIRDNRANAAHPNNGKPIFAFPEVMRLIELTIGSNKYKVDGEEREMDTAPFVKDMRTFVPIRFVAEALGKRVSYTTKNGLTDKVYIEL
jgi:hypothetical protein